MSDKPRSSLTPSPSKISNQYFTYFAVGFYAVVFALAFGLGFGLTSSTASKSWIMLRPYQDVLISNSTGGAWNTIDFRVWNYPWVSITGAAFVVVWAFYIVDLIYMLKQIRSTAANDALEKVNNTNLFAHLRIAISYAFLNLNWLFINNQGEVGLCIAFATLVFAWVMTAWLQEVLNKQNPNGDYRYMGLVLFILLWVVVFVIRSIYFGFTAKELGQAAWVIVVYTFMLIYDVAGMLIIIILKMFSSRNGKLSAFADPNYYALILNSLAVFQVVIFFVSAGPVYYKGGW